jgi:hypothetical protein
MTRTIRMTLLALPLIWGAALPTASAEVILGAPGSLWGQVYQDSEGLNGSGVIGNVSQGIDWFEIGGGVVVNTFAEYRYRARERNNLYYDAQGPAVGIQLKWEWLQMGYDVYWERFPELEESYTNKEYFITGYYDWEFESDEPSRWNDGFPGAIWIFLSHDETGINGDGGMGYVNQGIDWFTFGPGITFNTYAEYRFRNRSKNNEYYDTGGPAVGMEFRLPPFNVGAAYYWERLPIIGENSYSLQFYLTCYLDWDLLD